MKRLKNEYHVVENEECYFFIKKEETILAKVKIDYEDYTLCCSHLWILNSNGYVVSSPQKDRVNLHRLIMGLSFYKEDNRVVDHINHNKHDNRKINLKICSLSENSRNRISKENSVFSENIYRRGRIYE